MRVAMLDYGAGNLHSLGKALAKFDLTVEVITDPRLALTAELLILPGVGAFPNAAARIAHARTSLRDGLLDGLPCLGICLGMQLLFNGSEEGGGMGIGLIAGRVRRVQAPVVPHMGWNTLDDVTDHLVRSSGMTTGYYAHSFVCHPSARDVVTAWTTAGGSRFPAVVRRGNTIGVQFHPEKSSAPGLRFIGQVVSHFCSRGALR